LPLYEYRCKCGKFELKAPMLECAEDKNCPKCGQLAPRVFSSCPAHWGFSLSASSHQEGNPDKIVSRKPSNDYLIKV
jgi:putative FmdB family regulatory protein